MHRRNQNRYCYNFSLISYHSSTSVLLFFLSSTTINIKSQTKIPSHPLIPRNPGWLNIHVLDQFPSNSSIHHKRPQASLGKEKAGTPSTQASNMQIMNTIQWLPHSPPFSMYPFLHSEKSPFSLNTSSSNHHRNQSGKEKVLLYLMSNYSWAR
jgi:hypothetical protein